MHDPHEDNTYASLGAAPDLVPVAVTRWSARLVDPECERGFLLHRFPEDRRRVLFLTALVGLSSITNFFVEHFVFAVGDNRLTAMLLAAVSMLLPVAGFIVALRTRAPGLLQLVMLIAIALGTVTRLIMLTLRPDLADMWTTLMVGIVFVIYLYLPIRVVAAVGLAVVFSAVALLWWYAARDGGLSAAVLYRGAVCLVLANALGFVAANSLQRRQRMQYAQGLVMRQLLSTDAMTGIANRRRFDIALAREWQRCRRANAPISLLMIDVDHFKAYNDHCGHPQGDACLRQLAKVLVATVRRPCDIVARYGGEEFVCLLPDIGARGALAVANKLTAALRQADIHHPRSPAGPRLTISIGVATGKMLDGTPAGLVECADKLLYAAKAAGRNQIAVGQLAAVPPALAA